MDYLIQCVMVAFYAIHFSPFFIHTSFFKFVQGTFIFLIMLFSVLMIQTVKYMYYTSHRPPTQTCTHHSYQEIQNIVLVSLQAMLMHENGTSMQLFFNLYKNKNTNKIWYLNTNYISYIYFHCDRKAKLYYITVIIFQISFIFNIFFLFDHQC